jgi:epoxyqueuosine reductase
MKEDTMAEFQLTEQAKHLALESGAAMVGVVDVRSLPEHANAISRLLPTARSVLIVLSEHSLAAIASNVNQMGQFDTIYTYNECARAANATSRFLESKGFPTLAVPAFIPIDMDKPGKGMRGEICWRRAAVRAGLGSYGESGLLVTKKYGAAVRISGLVTAAPLTADSPLDDDACDHCMECVKACPAGALSGNGKINKKLCGETIFKYGFRFFQRFVQGLMDEPTEELKTMVQGYELREMWQTFMTGNYYYCYKCQSQCKTAK